MLQLNKSAPPCSRIDSYKFRYFQLQRNPSLFLPLHHFLGMMLHPIFLLFFCLFFGLACPVSSSIWRPAPGTTTWQWQLQGRIDTSFDVDMYDIDLFDTPASTIRQLQRDGRTVICYFSAGSYEDW